MRSEQEGRTITVSGIVQGVGFRPFIYTLALRHHLNGTVCNTGEGVRILAAGRATELEQFIQELREQAPPLAHIERIETAACSMDDIDQHSFTIVESPHKNAAATTLIPPDIATCPACLADIQDPGNRRYRYPFTNCTNCGPRFTIIESIPYDRPATSMKTFTMCKACHEEYHNPQNRRFHAQPNACPECGPSLSWHDAAGERIDCKDVIVSCIEAINQGAIVAIRGLGGFQLCCDAFNTEAIATLRQRKNRPDKPLALMMQNLSVVQTFCHLQREEHDLLLSPAHPIVLLGKKKGTSLAANICPHIDDMGIMLPYTPLHHLLFLSANCPQALVMTSGNRGGLPICRDNNEALQELHGIADYFLLHNRDIVTRIDDSVLKVMAKQPRLFRRARGYCPTPLQLACALPQTLACGGGLKSTFCLGRSNRAFISQHIGDLNSLENLTFYRESIAHHQAVFEIEPEICVCDQHPDYLSSQYGEKLASTRGLPLYTVQHHHAHAAAVMAEHHLQEEILALIFDGTGLGDDGTVWGGEILQCDLTSSKRLCHLSHLALPGGDTAAKEPWRMGLAALSACYDGQGYKAPSLPKALASITSSKREIVLQMIHKNLNSPKTSSCGRLFDAVAAILGVRLFNTYEGQAALELESLATLALPKDFHRSLQEKLEQRMHTNEQQKLSPPKHHKVLTISSKPLIETIMQRQKDHLPPALIALDFHLDLIVATTEILAHLARQNHLTKVVLSGGCMQNRILLEGFIFTLRAAGLTPYTGKAVPINDGGLSLGQLIVGGMQHLCRGHK